MKLSNEKYNTERVKELRSLRNDEGQFANKSKSTKVPKRIYGKSKPKRSKYNPELAKKLRAKMKIKTSKSAPSYTASSHLDIVNVSKSTTHYDTSVAIRLRNSQSEKKKNTVSNFLESIL